MGKAEHEYLSVRPPSEQRRILMDYVNSGVPCVVMCWGLAPLPVLLELAESHGVPMFTSLKPTGEFIRDLELFLVEALAPTEERHGVLVQVHDLGILIRGTSGIGKSETALELVLRGHRMVADDLVRLRRSGDEIIGSGCPCWGNTSRSEGWASSTRGSLRPSGGRGLGAPRTGD